MRVVCCVKEASLLVGPVLIGRDQRLAPECLDVAVNPPDLFALEAALRLRERGIATEVVAFTAGSGALERTATWCAAMGANRVVRLRAPGWDGLEGFGRARVLARAIATLGADLVLCGQRSADGGSGLVPPALAAAMGVPYVSEAARLHLEGGRLTVERKLERGARAVWRTVLPAVVAWAAGTNVPRYVSVAAEIMARRVLPLDVRWEDVGVEPAASPPRASVRALMPARVRPKKTATPATGMEAADKLRLIMTGGIAEKKEKRIVRGDPETAAEELLAFLRERQLLARWTISAHEQP